MILCVFIALLFGTITFFKLKSNYVVQTVTAIKPLNRDSFYLRSFNFARKNFMQIITVVFSLFYILWFFSFKKNIDQISGLEESPLSGFETISTALIIWFTVASSSLILINGFFKIKFINNLVKWLCSIAFILAAIFVQYVHILWNKSNEINQLPPFVLIFYCIYIGLGIYCCILAWIKDSKLEKVSIKQLVIACALILGILIVSMPSWIPQLFFGKGNPQYHVQDLSADHRFVIYGAIITPFIIYFAFRNGTNDIRKSALLYISLVTMFNFSFNYTYESFAKPWDLPFHLCNMAMYILPICLIFNTKRLFYFTYFINVFGALLAILMPNYSENARILEEDIIYFWYNHYCAFGMPLLCVALGVFEKPKMKQMWFAIIGFTFYFVCMLILNTTFTAMGHDVDYFFLNSNYVVDKLGKWAENLFDIKTTLVVGGLSLEFHPIYQFLFYLVYVVLAFGMWYVYLLFFNIASSHKILYERKKKIKLDHYALLSQLNGRSVHEPMIENTGIKLTLSHFTKHYGNSTVYAVKDANLTVNGGEIFGFLGPNGAGKSTTIKCIVGIQTLTSGEINVCGYDVVKQPVDSKKIIGYVPDHYALYEKLTGQEYINFIADIYEVSKEDRTSRINYYVELFHLKDAFNHPIGTYSHGMKQKITIIAALIHNPKVWILDEPLTGLDPDSIYQVKECMKHHAEQGNIVMFSSHIIDVVENLCSRIVIIKKGHMMEPISIEEIHKTQSLEQFYLSSTIKDEIATTYDKGEIKVLVKKEKKERNLKKKQK